MIAHPAASTRGIVLDERALADLVEAGLGGLEVDHRENLTHGKRVLLDWAIPPLKVTAIFLERRHLPHRIRAFLDFIRAEARQLTKDQ